MVAINIKAQANDISQIDALKDFMKTLKIKFEILKESPYESEFVDRILQAEKDFSTGKGINMSIAEFQDLCK